MRLKRRAMRGQVDVVVFANLARERAGQDLDRPAQENVAELLRQRRHLARRRLRKQADHQAVADPAERVVVAVEAEDLGGSLGDIVGDEVEAFVARQR